MGGTPPRRRLAPFPSRASLLYPPPARGLILPGGTRAWRIPYLSALLRPSRYGCHVWGMRLSRLGAWCGVVGPVLFTAAWVVSSLRQSGHCVTEVQLSGLAADDARDPQIMMAGFVVLGVCSIGFGIALRRALSPRADGAWLVIVAGAAAVAAGVFRRDHLLLVGPGFTGESWHNQVHDVVSGVAYGAMLAAPLVLGRRFRDDPDWAVLSRPVQVLSLASAVALAVFASRIAGPWNGAVQRIAVALPLIAEVLIAGRMLTLPPAGSPAGPGIGQLTSGLVRGFRWYRPRRGGPSRSPGTQAMSARS